MRGLIGLGLPSMGVPALKGKERKFERSFRKTFDGFFRIFLGKRNDKS